MATKMLRSDTDYLAYVNYLKANARRVAPSLEENGEQERPWLWKGAVFAIENAGRYSRNTVAYRIIVTGASNVEEESVLGKLEQAVMADQNVSK